MRVRLAWGVALIVAVAAMSGAQETRGQAKATMGQGSLTIYYGRPSLQGRDMLAQASPGTVWRLGSGEATRLVTDADLVVGELDVPKGQYSLFAKRLDDKNWRLIVNEQVGQEGTEYDATRDLGSTPLAWETKNDSTEQFTIGIVGTGGGGELRFIWGANVLKTNFEVQ